MALSAAQQAVSRDDEAEIAVGGDAAGQLAVEYYRMATPDANERGGRPHA